MAAPALLKIVGRRAAALLTSNKKVEQLLILEFKSRRFLIKRTNLFTLTNEGP